MSNPAVIVTPRRREVLSGESLLVWAILHNRGETAVDVPFPDAPSPFRYRLTSETHRVELDNTSFVTLLRHEPPAPVDPAPPFALAPGSKVPRSEDVAALSAEPLAPGAYEIVADLRAGALSGRSSPARISIVAPRPIAWDGQVCARRGTFASALAHRDPSAVALLVRESYTGRPELGVYRRVAERPVGAGVRSLCTSVDTADIIGGRWVAWLEGDALFARRVWGPTVESSHDAIALPFRGARLARSGLQLADGSGLFLAVGEGRAAAVRLTATSAAVVADVPLAAEPELVATRWDGQAPCLVHTCAGELREQRVLEGAGPARVLAVLSGPPLALSARPLGGPITWLEDGDEARLHQRADAAPLRTWALPKPEAPVRGWSILEGQDLAAPWVLAVTADGLLASRASAHGEWLDLGRLADGGEGFIHGAIAGAAWVTTADPARGLRTTRLPR